jgi:hypothetical protein
MEVPAGAVKRVILVEPTGTLEHESRADLPGGVSQARAGEFPEEDDLPAQASDFDLFEAIEYAVAQARTSS